MKFQDAVKKSIKAFINGKIPQATDEMSEGGIFHTPAYFDELEEQMLSDDGNEEILDEDV
jgi:hypothetical protein|tara:strand:+ start:267 stop:446 length:180 start_codon:yes stop_codon:yes gene_type:complete